MVQFISSATLLYFLNICLTINIIHAPQKDQEQFDTLWNDYLDCLNEISFAYKSESSTDCYRYAVINYKKGEFIPGTYEQQQNAASTYEQQQNAASTYEQQQNAASTSNQNQDIASIPDQYQNVASSSNQYQNVANISQREESLYHILDSSAQYVSNQNYGQPSYNPTYNSHQYNPAFIQDASVYNIVDSSSPYVLNQNNDQSTPSNLPDDFNFDFSDPLFNFDGLQAFIEADQQQYFPNYATAYFKELEKMAQGSNIDYPSVFCYSHFPSHPNCLRALKIFGATPKSAAYIALTKLKLFDVENNLYTYGYMLHISTRIQIISPSKNSKNFCGEIFNNEDWYRKMKNHKQTNN